MEPRVKSGIKMRRLGGEDGPNLRGPGISSSSARDVLRRTEMFWEIMNEHENVKIFRAKHDHYRNAFVLPTHGVAFQKFIEISSRPDKIRFVGIMNDAGLLATRQRRRMQVADSFATIAKASFLSQ